MSFGNSLWLEEEEDDDDEEEAGRRRSGMYGRHPLRACLVLARHDAADRGERDGGN